MQRRTLILSALSAGLGACAAPTPSAPLSPQPVVPFSGAAEDFDIALYRAVGVEAGNHFLSPFSVACAFALLYPGARGQTAGEIASVLGFERSSEAQTARTRALIEGLRANTGNSAFSLANAAWVERTMALNPDYARTIGEQMGATVEAVDFIASPSRALARINRWASEETRGRIPEILSEPDPSRRLVLTNAVYFKGKWRAPFSANNTRDGVFRLPGNATAPARMMRQTTHARYLEEGEFQAAEFDYDDGAFALSVFLPRDVGGLAAFEAGLTGARLTQWLERLGDARGARLAVTLPKVELRADYSLVPQLQTMGMRLPFTSAADFSGVTAAEALMISDVIHKTFLAIDEEGTEAAAVTAIDMVATAAPIQQAPPIEFKADRPFFIVLRHKLSGARLFMGRIATTA